MKHAFLPFLAAAGLLLASCAQSAPLFDEEHFDKMDSLIAQLTTPKDLPIQWTEASELTLTGKLMPTANPYHRVDTTVYKGFSVGENLQVRCPAGVAVAFRTDSRIIKVKALCGEVRRGMNTTMTLASAGVDLYIRKDGRWLWANAVALNPKEDGSDTRTVIDGMDDQMKECLLYLPIYTELYSFQIGVEETASMEALDMPFRHRVAIFGSSYTQGISTSRAGMAYPAQFTRSTGIQLLTLGCSGNCKMQPYFGAVLADVDAEAFIFDAFSNPDHKMIRERLFPFIEQMQQAHPGKPLIFQQTIYRERRNFNRRTDIVEQAKMDRAATLMAEACRTYKDVYFIQTNATAPDHETSVDGTHPGDYGYSLWAKSIEKPVLKILAAYGIR